MYTPDLGLIVKILSWEYPGDIKGERSVHNGTL